MPFPIQVSDLLAAPGTSRREAGSIPISVRSSDAAVDDDVPFHLDLRSLSDGLVGRGSAQAAMDLHCSSCLTGWTESVSVPLEAVFRLHPQDEEEYPIASGGWIDVEPVVHDEVSLALPLAPRCRPDCRGLCPTCGTDLNTDPCDGHDDVTDSPFAVLQGIFEATPDETDAGAPGVGAPDPS